MLHHFFENHGLGEKRVHLHADNCVAQNKNNTVLQYLLWRVMCGLHESIVLSFMLVGHTKFSPDQCFGLLKHKFRRTFVSSLADLVNVVETSGQVNKAQLVGDKDGNVIVPCLDWSSSLGKYFRRLPNIKGYQHFRIERATPGVVFARHAANGEEVAVNLLIGPHPDTLSPELITPLGLSIERQTYLYQKIREFCREDVRDEVCPCPAPLLPPPPDTQPSPQRLPQKRTRKCGSCGEEGHTKWTCPHLNV